MMNTANGRLSRGERGGERTVKISKGFIVGLAVVVFLLFHQQTSGQSFWEHCPGSGGGIFSITINSEGHIFIGRSPVLNSSPQSDISTSTNLFGVYRSTDNGETWTQTELKTINVMALAVNRNNHIFAGTVYPEFGVFRSFDNGDHWDKVYASDQTWFESMAINSEGDVFVGGSEGVLRSEDNGDTWVHVNHGLEVNSVVALVLDGTERIYAGVRSSVYRSADNGDSWAEIFRMDDSWVYDIAFDSKGHIFIGTANAGVVRSKDDGETWENVTSNLRHGWVRSIMVNSRDDLYAGTSGAVSRSLDGGDTWMDVASGLPEIADIQILTLNADEEILAGTYGYGVYRSILSTVNPKGDVNSDGLVNILDVIRGVNIILERVSAPTRAELWLSDLDTDGEITVQDMLLIIQMVLQG